MAVLLRRALRPPFGRRFFSSEPFSPPPNTPRRLVGVTGLGMVTPLGCGVERTWSRLVAGQCGIRALVPADLKMDGFDEATVMHTYEQLASKVAAIVPCGKEEGEFDEEQWLRSKMNSICGRRPEMEDAAVVAPRFFEIPLRMLTSDDVDGLDPSSISLPAHFFGVYDGHGGAQVANYCRDRVHLALVEELRNVAEGLGGGRGDAWKKQWERVFIDCFQKVDDEVEGKARRGDVGGAADAEAPSESAALETVGSTACATIGGS